MSRRKKTLVGAPPNIIHVPAPIVVVVLLYSSIYIASLQIAARTVVYSLHACRQVSTSGDIIMLCNIMYLHTASQLPDNLL